MAYVPTATRTSRGKMSDEDIEKTISQMIDDAVSYIDTDQEPDRELATSYYHGRPFGDEEEGRSKVVMTVVRDTILGMLPSLLRLFAGPERVVEFEPTGLEDEELAKQQTDYVNYCFMTDNDGAMILHSAFKDAAVRRTGIVKWWWDEAEVVATTRQTGVTDQGIETLLLDETVEIEVTDQHDLPTTLLPPGAVPPPTLYDVTVTRTSHGRLRVMAIPPEEIAWNKSARSLEDARILVHTTSKRVDELVDMGYEEKVVLERIGGLAQRANASMAESVRHIGRTPPNTTQSEEVQFDITKPVPYHEAYTRLDVDGKVKLWKLCFIGNDKKLVHKLPVSHIPLAFFTPDPEPHTIVGRSTADDTMDLQKIQSQIARGTLDSLALALDPALEAVDTQVEMADLLNTERSRVVRTKQPGMLRELRHTFVGPDALPMMEFFNAVKDDRTGQSRASQGLDADIMQSTTKAAVAATLTKAQERLTFIAFVYTYSGMRQLFRGLLKTIVENQDYERTVQLRGKYVEVDPRTWIADRNVIINVALGAGLMEDKIALYQNIAAKQEQVIGMVGITPFCGLSHYRHTLARMVEMAGERHAEAFFGDITPEIEQQIAQQMQTAKQGAGSSDAALLGQIEQMKNETAQKKAELDAQLRLREMALREKEVEIADDRERDSQAAHFVLEMQKLQTMTSGKLDIADLKAQVDLYRAQLGASGEAARGQIDLMKHVTQPGGMAQGGMAQGGTASPAEDDAGEVIAEANPYRVRAHAGRYCVEKVTTGERLKCYDDKDDALAYFGALEAATHGGTK
jgi:hypothetical protein